MSTPTPMPVFDSRPLESLKKQELSALSDLLELEPAKSKATKPELYNHCKAGLATHQHRFIKDPRFSHFYIYKEGSTTEPRKTSADKQQQNEKTTPSDPTPALLKLTLAKVSLDPPGHRVPRGLLDQLPYGSSDEVNDAEEARARDTDDSGSSTENSPTLGAASRKLAPAAPVVPSNAASALSTGPPAPAGPLALLPPGSAQNPMDFGLGFFSSLPSPPSLPSPDTHDISVHLHYPNAPVEEVQIQLDNSVEDIPFGLVDDPWTTKSARLTEMLPKVLNAHTPLKKTRGVLKSRGRNDNQLKYLGSLDKIRSGDYAKFSMRAADTQALVSDGGRYKLDLWVFPDEPGSAPHTLPAQAPGPTASTAYTSTALPSTGTTATAGPTALLAAARNVDKDEAFTAWLRHRLTEFGIAMPSKRLPGDNLGQVAVRVRLYDAAVKELEDNGWRVSDREGWKVPESEETYPGCSFTLAGFFKLFYMGRSQALNDWSLFKDDFDEDAHAELQAFREDPDEYSDLFGKMKRKQLEAWKKDKLEDKKEKELEEQRRHDKRERYRKRDQEHEWERERERHFGGRSHASSHASHASSSRRKHGHSRSPPQQAHSFRKEASQYQSKKASNRPIGSDGDNRYSQHASTSSRPYIVNPGSRYQEIDDDNGQFGDEDNSEGSQQRPPGRSSRKVQHRLTSEDLDN